MMSDDVSQANRYWIPWDFLLCSGFSSLVNRNNLVNIFANPLGTSGKSCPHRYGGFIPCIAGSAYLLDKLDGSRSGLLVVLCFGAMNQ